MPTLNRTGVKHWIFTAFFFLSVSIATCLAETTNTVTVTFYHTSDIHENSANLPQIARFIRDQKEKDSNVLFLDTGDWFRRGDLSPLNTRGEAVAAMMQACMYDAVIPGNSNYAFGSKRLVELVDKYSLPLLCANCVWPENMKPKNVAPYRFFAFDGLTVAVIGTTPPFGYDVDGLLKVHGIVESVRSLVSDLDEKVDIIVLMTHIGFAEDQEVAQALPPVDLIVGGHDHLLFETLFFGEKTQTVIQHSGEFGKYIGEIVLKWDGEKIVDRKVQIINITPDMPKCTKLEAMRKKYLSTLPGYWECLQRGFHYSICARRLKSMPQ